MQQLPTPTVQEDQTVHGHRTQVERRKKKERLKHALDLKLIYEEGELPYKLLKKSWNQWNIMEQAQKIFENSIMNKEGYCLRRGFRLHPLQELLANSLVHPHVCGEAFVLCIDHTTHSVPQRSPQGTAHPSGNVVGLLKQS